MVIVLAALVWYYAFRPQYSPVFTRLQPGDAASIVAQLEKEKIPYRLSDGGSSILVPQEQVDSTRIAILGSDLPVKGTVGLELFGKSDMGMTDFAQRINYQRALQGELARTILAIKGVETVRVHLALGEDRVFRADRVPPKASVVIEMRDGAPVSAQMAQGIRSLVAASIEQLQPGNVAVIDDHGRIIGDVGDEGSKAMRSPDVAARQAVEAYFEAKVRQALDPVAKGQVIQISVMAARAEGQARLAAPPGMPDWNIGARNFRLEVTLASRNSLDPALERAVLDAARRAIGFDGAKGDEVAFGAWSAGEESPLPDEAASAISAAPPPIQTDDAAGRASWGPMEIAGAGCGAILLSIVALLLFRRRRHSTGDDLQNEDFIRRFSDLLHEDMEAKGHASV